MKTDHILFKCRLSGAYAILFVDLFRISHEHSSRYPDRSEVLHQCKHILEGRFYGKEHIWITFQRLLITSTVLHPIPLRPWNSRMSLRPSRDSCIDAPYRVHYESLEETDSTHKPHELSPLSHSVSDVVASAPVQSPLPHLSSLPCRTCPSATSPLRMRFLWYVAFTLSLQPRLVLFHEYPCQFPRVSGTMTPGGAVSCKRQCKNHAYATVLLCAQQSCSGHVSGGLSGCFSVVPLPGEDGGACVRKTYPGVCSDLITRENGLHGVSGPHRHQVACWY